MKKKILGCCVIVLCFYAFQVEAGVGLQLPRYVSVKSSEANVRTGPGINHPILWVLKRKNLPVEIVAESKQWRKIKDIDGDEGWVHQAMLSGRRTVLVIGDEQIMYSNSHSGSRPLARVEKGVGARLMKCEEQFCEVLVEGYKGWLQRQYLWGVYPDERID